MLFQHYKKQQNIKYNIKYMHKVGRRKSSVANVKIVLGTGNICVGW